MRLLMWSFARSLRQGRGFGSAMPGAFDNPAAWEDDKALCDIGTLDDFNGPLADFPQSIARLVARLAAVNKNIAQPRKATDHFGEQQRCGLHRISFYIGQDMSLATLIFWPVFPGSGFASAPTGCTARPAAFGGYHALGVHYPGNWAGLAPVRFATGHQLILIQRLPMPIVTP